jgi:hypothetical protein
MYNGAPLMWLFLLVVDKLLTWKPSLWASRAPLKRLRVCSVLGLEVAPWMLLILTMPQVLDLAIIVTATIVATIGPLARRALLPSSKICGICVATPMMWLTRAWR